MSSLLTDILAKCASLTGVAMDAHSKTATTYRFTWLRTLAYMSYPGWLQYMLRFRYWAIAHMMYSWLANTADDACLLSVVELVLKSKIIVSS